METVVISGASGNLGSAVLKRFLEANYKVIGIVVPNDPVKINLSDKNLSIVSSDLLKPDEAENTINEIVGNNGKINVAVLTVGGFASGSLSQTKASDILRQYQLNFETAYNLARPIFLHMMKQGSGRIFLVGSRPGMDMHNSKGMVAYGLSKSLIFRLAELLNDEAKGKNVVTSVIVPSTIDTPQNRVSMPDADFNKWVKPEAIADVIYFYSSPQGFIIREPIIKVYNEA